MKRYGTILADPPWNYRNAGCRGAAENQYSTMAVGDVMSLPVPSNDNAVLIEWCTWPQLQEGLRVMEAWGFSYVTGFPWIKITDINRNLFDGSVEIGVPYGVGFWARGCTEFVLIGTKGKVSPPTNGFVGLLSPNAFHSRKPSDIYEYAEALPGPRLEMFARRRREGWDAFGNEVEGSITL